MKLLIIVPTYNEADNIIKLIAAIQQQFDHMCVAQPSLVPGILVVDDRSPDGTGERVREAARRWLNVYLIEGVKAGLAEPRRRFKNLPPKCHNRLLRPV